MEKKKGLGSFEEVTNDIISKGLGLLKAKGKSKNSPVRRYELFAIIGEDDDYVTLEIKSHDKKLALVTKNKETEEENDG